MLDVKPNVTFSQHKLFSSQSEKSPAMDCKWTLALFWISLLASVSKVLGQTETSADTTGTAVETTTPLDSTGANTAMLAASTTTGATETTVSDTTTAQQTTLTTTSTTATPTQTPTETSAAETTNNMQTTSTPASTTQATTANTPSSTTATTIITTTTTQTVPQQVTTQTQTTAGTTTPVLTTSAASTGATKSPTNSNNILIGVLVALAIVILLFAVVMYYYCTRKRFPCMKMSGLDGENIPLDDAMATKMTYRKSIYGKSKFVVGQMVIKEHDFESEYMKKSADDNRNFRIEFLSIEPGTKEKNAANHANNKVKNRYDNVLPYDATRVLLKTTDGNPTSDYINANFISGYLQDKKWIACQGPKPETLDDFWQMVWEQNTHVIIMVTRLVEQQTKIKCEQYWPDETRSFGNYTVTLTEVKQRNFYVVRTMELKYRDESPRTIHQFHYIAWPDFGVPSNPAHLLQFRRRIISITPPHSGPTVVHCSAGVGRTGTYIVVDAALQQLKAEGQADLFTFLSHIRTQRMMLVQTDAQYAFAHKAIVESIKYGVSEVSVPEFKKRVPELRERLERSEETEVEIEFQKLLKIPLSKDCLKHGRKSLKKNRVLQIMPYDFNRVTLPRKPGHDRSDYINASYIDGFFREKTFIATQGPLDDTIHDFCTMLWQTDIKEVVMLTRLEEKGQSTCKRYWPSSGSSEPFVCSEFEITLANVDDDDIVEYVIRDLVLTNSQFPGEKREIRQFHYKGWPNMGSGTPKDAQGLIEIVQRLKIGPEQKDPVVVHCSSGGGRTGVFCALSILINQAESEHLVDVFQTVRYLREQRPHMIQTQEQYYFCYTSMLQYLDSNQTGDVETLVGNGLKGEGKKEGQSTMDSLSRPEGSHDVKDVLGSMSNQLISGSTSTVSDPVTDNPAKTDSYDSDVPLVVNEASNEDEEVGKNDGNSATESSNSTSEFEIVNEANEK